MAKNGIWDIIINTLKKAGVPLSPKEIWDKSLELNTRGDFETTGKTPWYSIGAYCYTDIKRNGEKSKIIQTLDGHPQFYLRELLKSDIDIESLQSKKDRQEEEQNKKEKSNFLEKDLHTLLVAYADNQFKANIKTISEKKSSKKQKGSNEWLHPDLVGVYFPFDDYVIETIGFQEALRINTIKLYSFELKIKLSFSNLRESYFQSVSNSSWANEGYLVALDIDYESDFINELKRLNNAFGIGIIRLDAENVYESEILFPSRIKQEVDWDTVNRLASENLDFKGFLKSITEDCKLGKVKSSYDKVLQPEELTEYIVKNKISLK